MAFARPKPGGRSRRPGSPAPIPRPAFSRRRRSNGGALSGAHLLAGIEVRLDPHFITYWRDPGDAGVPPSFDAAASANLKSVEVRYPAPERLDEAGAQAFGYSDDVVFPLLVTPLDPAKPVTLAVEFDYAACYNICLPARAELTLTLDGRPSAEGDRVLDALAAVPRRAQLGPDGPLPRILDCSTRPWRACGGALHGRSRSPTRQRHVVRRGARRMGLRGRTTGSGDFAVRTRRRPHRRPRRALSTSCFP